MYKAYKIKEEIIRDNKQMILVANLLPLLLCYIHSKNIKDKEMEIMVAYMGIQTKENKVVQ